MKRDLDLIRDIMLMLEENLDYKKSMKDADLLNIMDIPNLAHETLNYHLGLLCENNFIEATELRVFGGDRAYIIRNITQSGHDFIDTFRSKNIWEYAKENAIKGGTHILSFLVELGKDYLKKQIGL